ncbi:gamma conglutin 1 [Ricinus communis]|uniref:gamma conglutin 1 n=1 Tax=Ricinus communis TaxID=3988 RepID=UPI00201AC05C|nr:gamma conglutin 1 [Ricinus communis]
MFISHFLAKLLTINYTNMLNVPSLNYSLVQAFLIPTMASSSLQFLLIILGISFVVFVSDSQTLFKPNNLMLLTHKDGAANLHVARISKRTPQTPLYFAVDLNGRFLWVNCEKNYVSSTYRAPRCHSTQCSRANSQYCHKCSSKARPGCHNNTCGLMSANPVTHQNAMGEVAQDMLSIQSTRGSNPGPVVMIPQFLFVCAPSRLLQLGIPIYVQGIAGLGHAPIALPTQFASHFGFRPSFALCLSSTSAHSGVIFFGQGPFYMLPGIDVSSSVGYTPLIISREGEYHVGVRSIRINHKAVPLNTSLLKLTKRGTGGTMISTITPYTTLEHSIHQAFTKFFTNQLSSIPQLTPVAPFSVCYDSKRFARTRAGPGVPNIDLVFSSESVVWTILGANSMVEAHPGVLCLGFVDGGLHPRASVVVGAHQLEDNLVQFDLARSRLGFSSSLLSQRTSCANFNFTQTP